MDLLFERGSSKHEYDLLSAYVALAASFLLDGSIGDRTVFG
jgi:hypothetical protein